MPMSISRENEELLNEVVASGQFGSRDEALAQALRLLKDAAPVENGLVLSPEVWRQKFEKHLGSTPGTTATTVDDSRENIYEGRGE